MHPYVLKQFVYEAMQTFISEGKSGEEASEAMNALLNNITEGDKILMDFYIRLYIDTKGDFNQYMYGSEK